MKKALPKTASKQLLILLSVVIIILLIAKLVFFKDTHLSFLLWNIFLAWIPLLSLFLIASLPKKMTGTIIAIIFYMIWLIFYPNAPYLITDLVHISKISISHSFQNIDLLAWLEITIVFLSIWLGILLSFYSLYPIHSALKSKVGTSTEKILLVFFSFLSSYGIYLGRFSRLNSWDLFYAPQKILLIIKNSFNINNFMFISLFALIFYLIYNSLYVLKHNK